MRQPSPSRFFVRDHSFWIRMLDFNGLNNNRNWQINKMLRTKSAKRDSTANHFHLKPKHDSTIRKITFIFNDSYYFLILCWFFRVFFFRLVHCMIWIDRQRMNGDEISLCRENDDEDVDDGKSTPATSKHRNHFSKYEHIMVWIKITIANIFHIFAS